MSGLPDPFSAMERYASLRLLGALQTHGLPGTPGTRFDAGELASFLQVLPQFHPLCDALIEVLRRGGILERHPSGMQVAGGCMTAAVERADLPAQRALLLQRYPGLGPHLRLLDTCTDRLCDVLAGHVPATEVIFPGGEMTLVKPIYTGNSWADHFNQLVAMAAGEAVALLVEGHDTRVRILEVGAGTGGTTEAVLAAIADRAELIDYYYTDISPGFVRQGRSSFAATHPFTEFSTLDLERDPARQGFANGCFDVIIATNVVHATRDVRATMARLAGLLRPQGLLLLNELTRTGAFATLTFGLLDGWWHFTDPDTRAPHGPIVAVSRWRAILQDSGFTSPSVYGWNGESENSFQCLFVAERMAQVADGESLKAGDLNDATRPAAEGLPGRIATELATLLALAPEEITPERPFAELGVDSIIAPQFVAMLNRSLGCTLVPSDVFNYVTIRALADHLASPDDGAAYRGVKAPARTDSISYHSVQEPCLEEAASSPGHDAAPEKGIAVIGLACRVPGAADADTFWDNLIAGRSAITEVPRDRWDYRPLYHPDGGPGRITSRWGGFLTDHDKFDPEFFRLSFREAEAMSPQQRVFLESAWHAIEDAGYAPGDLAGARCGVFVGVANHDYGGEIADSRSALGNSNAILSARISYLLDLKGPNLPVDTACSSSLVTIHMACRSILAGECDTALAGGVSVLLTDSRLHRFLSDSGMASPTGQCHTFDVAADGFVPGEGVGIVMLKSLSKAIADGDHIYGVIKGSAVNQDGRTSGITAPNGPSQTALECEVYDAASIDPRSIGYVEAHGTGTALGDPIEVNALKAAFGRYTDATGFCALGSVKANIGHLLTAAGVASFIKAILALQRNVIPPSLNFGTVNPRIDLMGSAFFVNTAPRPWPRRPGSPRRAAISSFGFSGTNAHVVVEEAPAPYRTEVCSAEPFLFLISARTADQLAARLAGLANWLQRHDPDPCDAAFTLAAGRAHFEHRCAIIAASLPELRTRLLQAQSGISHSDIKVGRALAAQDPALDTELARAIATASTSPGPAGLRAIAALYCQGAGGDWRMLFAIRPPRRVSLPGYPFERLRFWIDGKTSPVQPASHPLITPDRVDGTRARYRLNLRADGGFLTDHRHENVALLPATACLEAVRAAAQACGLGHAHRLSDVAWIRPLRVDGGDDVVIELTRNSATEATFRIVSGEGDGVTSHVTGHVGTPSTTPPVSTLDLGSLAQTLPNRMERQEVYERFEQLGFFYGPGFRVIDTLGTDGTQVLGFLRLPAHLHAGYGDYVLHPALLDGAIQTAIGLTLGTNGLPHGTVIPVSLAELTVHSAIPEQCAVWVTYSGSGSSAGSRMPRLDVRVASADGQCVVELRDLVVRIMDQVSLRCDRPASALLYVPEWQPRPASPASQFPVHGLIFALRPDLTPRFEGKPTLVTPGSAFVRHGADHYEINIQNDVDFVRLWQALESDNRRPDAVLHLWNLGVPALDVSARRNGADAAAALNADLATGFWPLVRLVRTMPPRPASQPLDILHVHRSADLPQPHHAMLAGFAASVARENPAVRIRSLTLIGNDPIDLGAAVGAELAVPGPHAVRLTGQDRRVPAYRPAPTTPGTNPLRHAGTYVITGGAGGIGSHLARHLAQGWNARLALVGRSPQTPTIETLIAEIEDLGGRAIYLSADLCDEATLRRGLDAVRGQFGPIRGVIQAAGVGRDGFLRQQNDDDIAAVLAPKLMGTLNLDVATADDPLDIFVCFSSMAGVLGNAGQAAYAAANAFLDGFASRRRGPGRTLSIDWSYWREGGLQNGATDDDLLFAQTGMRWLDTKAALHAFEQALTIPDSQVLAVAGDPERIAQFLKEPSAAPTQLPAKASPAVETLESGHDRLAVAVRYLTAQVAEATGMPPERIQARRAFEEYGIDSIMVAKLNTALEKDFGQLSKTLFYEHGDIRSLAGYFVTHYGVRLIDVANVTELIPIPDQTPARLAPPAMDSDAIAVIGVAGRYPGADDLDSFWKLLAAGRNVVGEIPLERWDHGRYFDPAKGVRGKTYSKWGGFLGEIGRFDPLFFNIAPGDAPRMDPQERLFLEVAWETIENAGYTRTSLASRTGARDVGVYVGVMYGDYQLFTAEEHAKGNPVYGASPYWSIANRVSYTLDLHGPSLAVDSACSSSVTAIHLACQSLRMGECHAALAGGVNLSLHPLKYLALAEGRFASSDGRCRSFGAGGDGYVPGEGVGAVLLKRLSDAIADGDHIHGIIRATAVNHGGKSNGYTVPNPVRQAAVIRNALARAGVDPASIGYVEAHGTGTALGDPIEIAGLDQAFGGDIKRGSCPIGSLKANIGHLEAAAGIAGVTKVLLQFRHKQLVPLPDIGAANPNIDFANTPFRLLRQAEPWTPREDRWRAGVSSFGAGGANGHVILEAYPDQPPQATASGLVPLVLSARTPAQLEAYRARLHAALTTTSFDLVDIAWTLMVGREEMEERMAFTASCITDAVACLAPRGTEPDCVVRGSVDPDRLLDPPDLPADLRLDDLSSVLRCWVTGAGVDWLRLGYRGRRVPLPAHPFLGKHYWLPVSATASAVSAAPALHPLLDHLVPSADTLTYAKRFRAGDRLLSDHRVDGKARLPGVAVLELARAAAAAGFGGAWHVAEIAWVAPFDVHGESRELRIALSPSDEATDFAATTDDGAVLARGRLVRPQVATPPASIDVARLRGNAVRRWDADPIYNRFRALGLEYGPSFRRLKTVAVAGNEVVADLDSAGPMLDVELPPDVLDAAFQALIGFQPDDGHILHVPFALGAVRSHGPLTHARHVHARRIDGEGTMPRFALSILDAGGGVLLTMSDLVVRARMTPPGDTQAVPLRFLRPMWRRDPTGAAGERARGRRALVLSAFESPADRALARSLDSALLEAIPEGVGPDDVVPHQDAVARYRRILARHPEAVSVYVTAGLGGESATDRLEARTYGLAGTFLALIQALVAEGRAEAGCRVVVLTRDLQGAEAVPADPAPAVLIGLAKTAAQEYPKLEVVLIDLDAAALSDPHLGERLEAECGGRPAVEIAYRGQRRYHRVLTPVAPSTDAAERLPEGAVVLILGGGRGIGLELAVHLSRTRHARLALIGRHPADESLNNRLTALRDMGGDAVYIQADGCDPDAMGQVVATVKARWGRIDAAVQSALVLRDVSLARMDPGALHAALDPKVRATLVLRDVLANEALKLFVVLSSANVFAGAAGQGNYVAASRFIDAFAEQLAATTAWPVVTINWGLWGEVGSVAGAAYQSRLGAQGIHPIAPEEGLAAFDAVLRSGLARVAVVRIAAGTLQAQGVAAEASPAIRLPGPDAGCLRAAAAALEGSPELPALRDAEAAFATVEALGRAALRAAFGRRAALPAGRAFTLAGLRRRLGIVPRHHRLFGALMDVLAEDGSFPHVDGLWRPQGDQTSVEAAERQARDRARTVRAAHPWIGAPLELLERCLTAYPEVLRGQRDPLELLFPGGSPAQLETIYDGSPIVDHFNARLADALVAFVKARLAGTATRPVRILEVGAGTGGTTAAILPALAPLAEDIVYVYSDLAPSFLRHGEARFAERFPFLEFAPYDLEREVEANGLAPGSFDVVLGTNVLHATTSLSGTLRRLKRALTRHGALLINEVTRRQDYATLIFGFTEGWWRSTDPDDRLPAGPLADAAQWRRLLMEAGYQGVSVHALASEDRASPQTLILAESDGWVDAGETSSSIRPAPVVQQAEPAPRPQPVTVPPRASKRIFDRTLDHLSDIFVDILKLDRADLRRDSHFDRYGMESLSALAVRDRLARDIPDLPATLLFEHDTLDRLATYLTDRHRVALETLFGDAAAPEDVSSIPAQPTVAEPAGAETVLAGTTDTMPIAIIGVTGRYPGAATLDAFWQMLVEGRRAITEVPADRWNADAHFDMSGRTEDRSYTKWGGFISDVDKFDPLFFGIAPLEAESMDPQERLFLEVAWSLLEDAGTTPERLRRVCDRGDGGDVGVFVGVMNAAYQWLAAEAWQGGNPAAGASAYWSIANRISYQFDFKGPSLAIDTACSSSLTAIHLACESLRRGECRAAIAGGVNLILHPRQFINLSRARMVSRGAECRPFGAGADGFVDGEGVGAVLLKPLADAERDGDRIEAVILGSAVNAGGRTSGFTVPSPSAQAGAIRSALQRAAVEPASIGYIEAHGTGTALGDPIEIAGLKLVFGDGNTQRRTIGSVKANIGHLESAAGIAGLTKVILQLRHGMIAPSPEAARPNPLIDFTTSPVSLAMRPTAWEPGPAPHGYWPRRAGISSFGAGGANAHLIVEEYRRPDRAPANAPPTLPDIVVLSARTAEQLQLSSRTLLGVVAAATPDDPAMFLADLAHTLRVGREPMAHRVALVVADLASLSVKLSDFVAGKQGIADLYHGVATAGGAAPDDMIRNDPHRLARLWVAGAAIDWTAWPTNGERRILSLPGTPFRRERYWIDRPKRPEQPASDTRMIVREMVEPPKPFVLLAQTWHEMPTENDHPDDDGTLVVCTNDRAVYEQIAARRGRSTLWLRQSGTLLQLAEGGRDAVLDRPDSIAALFRAFPAPYRLINLWRHGRNGLPGGLPGGLPEGLPGGLGPEDALLASLQLVHAAAALADRCTLIHAVPSLPDGDTALDHAAASLARTVRAEVPGVRMAVVLAEPADLIEACLREVTTGATDAKVWYRGGRRLVPVVEQVATPTLDQGDIGFRARGVYLIAGGLGEVGFALARELLRRYRARVAVIGRSPLQGALLERATQLESFGGTFLYLPCDLTNRDALDAAVAQVRQRFGSIHGVLHLARAVDPGSLSTLSIAEFRNVLSAKVTGTVHLDAALADDPLDWFVLFSSLAAWQGLPGAAGYATGCAFQDHFAMERAERGAAGQRSGRSVSICWPQWAYDRYLDDGKTERLRHLKLRTIDAAAGLRAIECALASGRPSVGILAGDGAAIDDLIGRSAPQAQAAHRVAPRLDPDGAALEAMSDDELAAYLAYLRTTLGPPLASRGREPGSARRAAVEARIVESFASYLKIAPADIGRDTAFADLGLDSIKALHIAERLQRRLGLDVAPSMFFEHSSAAALSLALTDQDHMIESAE